MGVPSFVASVWDETGAWAGRGRARASGASGTSGRLRASPGVSGRLRESPGPRADVAQRLPLVSIEDRAAAQHTELAGREW